MTSKCDAPAARHGAHDRRNPNSTSRSAPTAIRSSPAVRSLWIPRAALSDSPESSVRSPSPRGSSKRRCVARSLRLDRPRRSLADPRRQQAGTAAPHPLAFADLATKTSKPSLHSRSSTRVMPRRDERPISEPLRNPQVAGPVLMVDGQGNTRLLSQPLR